MSDGVPSLVPAPGGREEHEPGGSQVGVQPAEPEPDAGQVGHRGRAVARPPIERPARDVASARPRTRRRGTSAADRRRRTRRAAPAPADRASPASRRWTSRPGASSRTSRPDAEPRMPSASKPSRRSTPGPPRSTRNRPIARPLAVVEPGGHEGVGQVRQPGRPGLLPGEPPRAVAGLDRASCPGSRRGPASHHPPRSRRC